MAKIDILKQMKAMRDHNNPAGLSFDEAAMAKAIAERTPPNDEQLDGVAPNELLQYFINHYTSDASATPAVVPASRKLDSVVVIETEKPLAKQEEAQEFANNYVQEIVQPKIDSDSNNNIDDFIILAALGSMLGGAGVNELVNDKESEIIRQAKEDGLITQ